MMKFNGKVMKFGNYWGASGSVTPPPFLYTTNNIQNTYVNSAVNDVRGYPVRLVKDAT